MPTVVSSNRAANLDKQSVHKRSARAHTLISEEALLLAKFLRNERKEWNPRIVIVN